MLFSIKLKLICHIIFKYDSFFNSHTLDQQVSSSASLSPWHLTMVDCQVFAMHIFQNYFNMFKLNRPSIKLVNIKLTEIITAIMLQFMFFGPKSYGEYWEIKFKSPFLTFIYLVSCYMKLIIGTPYLGNWYRYLVIAM